MYLYQPYNCINLYFKRWFYFFQSSIELVRLQVLNTSIMLLLFQKQDPEKLFDESWGRLPPTIEASGISALSWTKMLSKNSSNQESTWRELHAQHKRAYILFILNFHSFLSCIQLFTCLTTTKKMYDLHLPHAIFHSFRKDFVNRTAQWI